MSWGRLYAIGSVIVMLGIAATYAYAVWVLFSFTPTWFRLAVLGATVLIGVGVARPGMRQR